MAGTGIWSDRDRRPYTAAVAIVAAVAVLIFLGFVVSWGPFGPDPYTLNPKIDPSPSIWQLLLSDRVTLGFGRIALAAIGLFVLASLAALSSTGRWINSLFGARTDPAKERKRTKAITDSTIEISRLKDDVQQRDKIIGSMQARLDQYEKARQEALAQLVIVRDNLAKVQASAAARAARSTPAKKSDGDARSV